MTLYEIIEAVKQNEPVDPEAVRYALLAMDSLHTFTKTDLRKLAMHPDKAHRRVQRMAEADFNRVKRAIDKDPKEWLGWDNDPENPEYRQRQAAAVELVQKLIKNKENKHHD